MKTVRSARDATTAPDYTKFSALCIRRFFGTSAFSGASAFFTRFRYFNGKSFGAWGIGGVGRLSASVGKIGEVALVRDVGKVGKVGPLAAITANGDGKRRTVAKKRRDRVSSLGKRGCVRRRSRRR